MLLPKGGTEQHGSKAPRLARQKLKCKCGSSEHKYTSHHNCPLNKKHIEVKNTDDLTVTADEDSPEEKETEGLCTCGSHNTTHRHSCPLNPRNLSDAQGNGISKLSVDYVILFVNFQSYYLVCNCQSYYISCL